MTDNNPSIMNLNPSDIVKWCNDRKKQLGYSNAKIAELSGVPIGTVDRIMAGRYIEYKYSSIQPIVSVLLTCSNSKDYFGVNASSNEVVQEFRHALELKNLEIENLKSKCDNLLKERDYLKDSIKDKDEDIEYLKRVVEDLRLRNKN